MARVMFDDATKALLAKAQAELSDAEFAMELSQAAVLPIAEQMIEDSFARKVFVIDRFDHKNLSFAGKICANTAVAGAMSNVDISSLKAHDEFKDMSTMDFMAEQDHLLDLTRNECAMIQVKTTDQGTRSFGLAQAMKRTTGPQKIRKDSYSALLVANWGLKLYVEAMAIQVQQGPPDINYQMVG